VKWPVESANWSVAGVVGRKGNGHVVNGRSGISFVVIDIGCGVGGIDDSGESDDVGVVVDTGRGGGG
jgi:hypothetical protein